MWSAVAPVDVESPAPSARSKHSATLIGEYVYLLGGRNGNLPMKDFWKYNLVTGKWHQLRPSGDKLPNLQEHSAVAYKDNIYIFGGEVGFSAGTETPLWTYDIKNNSWKKVRTKKGVVTPKGRRGHTALVHRGNMLIYGGYQDLKGSCSELWAFHFETESWHLLSTFPKGSNNNSDSFPPPRHKHSAIIHDDAMWVYGGMTDLQERADLWKWDIPSKTWTNIKTKMNPGPLHSHAVCRLPSSMLIFGGERGGHSTNELWKFNFSIESWEKITISGTKPQPRSESIAFTVSELLLNESSLEAKTVRIRARTCTSADRGNRHSSYLPNNRVAPSEKTYIFQPSQTNYIDGSDLAQQYAENGRAARSFLQEISKLSQISRLNNKCNYTVLTGCTTDSTESLLKQHASPQNVCELDFTLAETEMTTPLRGTMIKSKSACVIKKKSISPVDEKEVKKKVEFAEKKIPREPISVPNFSTLTLPTPVLTPVEAAKLVYLDTDDENDLINDVHTSITQVASSEKYDSSFNVVKRGESYSSHLAYADNPLYQHMINQNSVKFQDNPPGKYEENVSSTSDYASIETMNRLSSASNYSVKTNTPQDENQKNKTKDGPFGFCNPNYLGPDIKAILNGGGGGGNVEHPEKKNLVKLFQQDMRSSEEDLLELQNLNGIITKNTKVYYRQSSRNRPPRFLALENNNQQQQQQQQQQQHHHHQRPKEYKSRALSASRVERNNKIDKVNVDNDFDRVIDPFVPLYVYIIGGKEQGQVTVFQRPISIWKLKLF